MTVSTAPGVVGSGPVPGVSSSGVGGRGRWGLVAAWAVVVVCGGGAVVSGIALATPAARPSHTVIVSPTFTADQVSAAKAVACQAWERASNASAEGGRVVAKAPRGFDDPAKQEALALEARTNLIQMAYLRSRIGAATPVELTAPIGDYLRAIADLEHAAANRRGNARNEAINRVNVATRQVNAVCGLS